MGQGPLGRPSTRARAERAGSRLPILRGRSKPGPQTLAVPESTLSAICTRHTSLTTTASLRWGATCCPVAGTVTSAGEQGQTAWVSAESRVSVESRVASDTPVPARPCVSEERETGSPGRPGRRSPPSQSASPGAGTAPRALAVRGGGESKGSPPGSWWRSPPHVPRCAGRSEPCTARLAGR